MLYIQFETQLGDPRALLQTLDFLHSRGGEKNTRRYGGVVHCLAFVSSLVAANGPNRAVSNSPVMIHSVFVDVIRPFMYLLQLWFSSVASKAVNRNLFREGGLRGVFFSHPIRHFLSFPFPVFPALRQTKEIWGAMLVAQYGGRTFALLQLPSSGRKRIFGVFRAKGLVAAYVVLYFC